MLATLIAASEAFKMSFGLIFTFVILIPGIAAGLIAFAVVGAATERRQNRERGSLPD